MIRSRNQRRWLNQMNEELKIIINAVTAPARNGIKEVNTELKKLGSQSKSSGSQAGGAMKGMGKAFGVAAGVAVAAIAAIVAAVAALSSALVNLSKSTKEYRQEQAKLNTAFLSAGSTAEQASETYNNLFRFLGDSSKAVETAGHLAKLTTEEKALAEWTTALQGVYATFGDSLPIEGLSEAANESARVGKITGTMADALNWAGVSEDAFNASLAQTNSLAEREALIRGTLNGLYGDAARIYEQNNQEILKNNEAQARLDATMGRLGKVTTPLATAFLNLSNAIMTALGPAIEWLSNALTVVINAFTRAVQWVSAFMGILGGGTGAKGLTNTKQIATGINSASTGASKLASGLGSATKAAEKLKKTTASFDELNVMSSGSAGASAGGAGGAGGGIAPGAGNLGNLTLGDGNLTDTLDKTSSKVSEFVQKVKAKLSELAQVFAPTITAWGGAFDTIKQSAITAWPSVLEGLDGIKNGFMGVGTYLIEEFVPNVVNSFSTHLAPVIGDIFGFSIEEAGKTFSTFGGLIESICLDIINPALATVQTVVTDVFKAFGDAWDSHGAPFMEKASTFFDGLREDIEEIYYDVVLPIWNNIKDVFDKAWKEGLQPLVENVADAALEIGECVLDLYNKFIKPIVDWIQEKIYPVIVKIVNKIVKLAGDLVISISKTINGIITTIKGIVQFITGVFTGDWKKAWEGIKNIFKGIFETLVGVIRTPLNRIIDGINTVLNGIAKAVNTAIKAINKLSFTVPDWVPKIGGEKFGFNIKEISAPQIPKLATGGIVDSATLAVVGERGKEAVLPLENNTQWMDKLADKIASRNSSPSKIVLMLDEKQLGWANIQSINSITKQTGALQLSFV
jgi:phage-related protein